MTRAASSGHLQQAFVEAAELAGAVHQMDFQNPVARVAVAVGIAHARTVGGRNAMLILVAGNALGVRELAHDVARDDSTEFPPGIPRGGLRETIELCALNVW